MFHTYDGKTLQYEIKYKQRQSIRMTIDHHGYVEVHAPKGTSNDKIIQLLEGNWDVIQQKIAETKARMSGPQEKTYEDGESFLFLGKSYRIKISVDEKIEQDLVQFNEDQLFIIVKKIDDDRIKQALKRFYYKQCKKIVEKRIKYFQSHFKVKPRSVSISDSKTTWGTCDAKLQLTFNWRLAMAPQHVIDYVVVHEMCHMLHLNHDRSFWRLVGKIMPDYKEQEKWLANSNWKMTV
ncbi:zinc protease [Lottiidibacillus patelloidae]|uniref:Zinc protease n=1 Tax=Lottiidibacillus patelloidae TaxID=2670334 RepID=A0A263BUR4_9BACI|nr:SprT family zinc-dependent metalloprotease [Lottiidibacillus patelloidae]OZM56916.1 zinc protease [Lottiidibacillus patelloidae]